jgi:tripartite-type tricarboxylate transporter receptor subunit TctC
MFTRRVITTVFVSFAFWTGATATRAQDKFPSRTIRIIVPFAPGGGVDTLARLLAERMQLKMGVNVIVENRAGANGTIGGSHVLQSQPDGYTVLFSSNTHTMSKLVMSNAPYNFDNKASLASPFRHPCWALPSDPCAPFAGITLGTA